MKHKLTIQEKVDAAMESINHISTASASPYFYTRVMAKINRAKIPVWEKWSGVFLRPAITFGSIGFIIVVNAFVLYSKMGHDISSPDQNEQSEMAFSDGYIEIVTPLYDLENVKQ